MKDVLENIDSRLRLTTLTDLNSPSSIIIFSLIYSVTTSIPSGYDTLEPFFRNFLESGFAKKGIEMAALYSVEEGPSNSGAASGRNIEPGIFVYNNREKKMWLSHSPF